MTPGVVAAHEQATFTHLVESLARNRISCVPVVDADHRVLGVISESDLLAHLMRHRTAAGESGELEASAAELMTSPAVTVTADTSIEQAARRCGEQHVHRLPVVDAAGSLIGIVSRADLLRAYLLDASRAG